MKRLLGYLDKSIAAPLLQWLKRPLIDAVPWARRLRLYTLFLLLIALSSPFLHSYFDIALSPGEMVVHTLLVVAAVALAILVIETIVAVVFHATHRENSVSTGGFLLRAAAAYVMSNLLAGPMHQLSPFTRTIMEKHLRAGQTNTAWQVLPVALLIVYVAYQVMRKDYLARQVAALQRINEDLRSAQRQRSDNPEHDGDTGERRFTVQSNGVDLPLQAESILHIQADENYCHIVADLGNGEMKRYLVRMTLTEAAGLLPQRLFLQTHRSHVVNLGYVGELIRGGRQRELRLSNGDTVPISRARAGSVQSRIKEFLTTDGRGSRTTDPLAARGSPDLPAVSGQDDIARGDDARRRGSRARP